MPIFLTISGFSAPAADSPRKMSAPSITSASVVAFDFRQKRPRHLSLTSSRLSVSSPSLWFTAQTGQPKLSSSTGSATSEAAMRS